MCIRDRLNIEENNIIETYQKALKPIMHLIQKKNIHHSEIDLLNQKMYDYDEARIIQVFQNILGNAYKFTEDGGMTVSYTHLDVYKRQV